MILIVANFLIIVTSWVFLAGKSQATYDCSHSLYWVAVAIEFYLCLIIIRYVLFSVLHQCGLCDPSEKYEYARGTLQDFRRRFFVHVFLCLFDLVALTPLSVWAGGVLESNQTALCSLSAEIKAWTQTARALVYYTYFLLFAASICVMIGIGLYFFWRNLEDHDIDSADYYRQDEDSELSSSLLFE